MVLGVATPTADNGVTNLVLSDPDQLRTVLRGNDGSVSPLTSENFSAVSISIGMGGLSVRTSEHSPLLVQGAVPTATEARPQPNRPPSWKICPRTGRVCFGHAQDLCGRKFSCWLGAGPVVQRKRP